MIRNNFKILFFLLITAGTLFAQKFEMTADRTKVGVNERFQVYLTFEKNDNDNVSDLNPPSFEGFRILSGPNQSTNMQIINGNVSSSISFSYILTPQKVGSYTINKAQISYKGKKYETNTLNVQVIQGTTTQAQSGGGSSQMSDEELSKNVFIRASVDKQKVYRGEQVTVTFKLYTKLNISSPQISKLPNYNGFWQEEIPTDHTINMEVEMYNGERFRSAVIKKAALFPTQSGELEITPFELEIPVIVKKKRQSNDFFDEFFNDSFFGGTETIQFKARSNSIKINALPLPEGQPESFSGAVGEFDMKSDISSTNVKTNESVTLKFSISGKGNLELLNLPELKLPSGFEVYEPKSNVQLTNNNTIAGSKTFDYLVVPRIPGTRKIDPIEFSYFSPSKGKYITLKSPEYTLNIEKGEGTANAPASGFSKEDIKLLNEDIRYINTSDFDLQPKGESRLIGLWFWFSLIIPALVLAGAVGFKKRQDKLAGNVQLAKYRKAEKAARNRLKNAKKLMTGEASLAFYTEISRAMNGYLEDKLAIQKSDFTLDKAVEKLKQQLSIKK